MLHSLQYAFRDLQAHQVAELSATRTTMNHLLEKLSPQQLIEHFEQEGLVSWPKTNGHYWQLYKKFHHSIANDDKWCSKLLSEDYAKAYEEQVQLLNTAYQSPETQE